MALSIFDYFRQSPIRKKMILVIVGVTFTALLLDNVVEGAVSYSLMRQNTSQKLETIADLEAKNLVIALDFEDQVAAKEILHSLELESVIPMSCLYNKSGDLFSSFYAKESFKKFPVEKSHIHHAHEKCKSNVKFLSSNNDFNKLRVVYPVMSNDIQVGTIYIEYDLFKAHLRFIEGEVVAFVIVVFALFIAFILASQLQGVILKPIVSLKDTILNVGVLQDYSLRAHKEVNDEVGELIDSFNGMVEIIGERDKALTHARDEAELSRQEADNANAMKSEFLATMSHEIRTPMNGIIGMTELMLDTKLTHKQRNYAQTVINSAEALLNIINDILDFSKIEAGKLELEPIPFDLMQVVEDTADLLSIKAREKALELIVRYVPGTPQYLIGDPGRIRQTIANLIGNAIKFTEKGYILITVEEDRDAFLNDESYRLKISVKDTGIGIPSEAQEKLFQKFTQADASTTRKFGGTGLGLAICKQLAEMMEGDVGVDSIEGVGSTFWFTMNLEKDQRADNAIPVPDILQDIKVLIVDDIPVNCELLDERFKTLGMRPTYTCDSRKAVPILEQAKMDNDPYHIAVLDYLMPEINGEELAQQIKENPNTKDTALIMLTSAGGKGYTKRFQDAGFSSFLSKPVRTQELTETVALVWSEFSAGNTNELISTNHIASKNQSGSSKVEDIRFLDTHILLAEDNRTNQAFAQEILNGANCRVTIATNGREAINAISKEPYDLVFMDCEMPEVNGFEASEIIGEMKKDKLISDIPIVALTANAMKGDKERCLNAGMIDYLSKPMRKNDMLEVVKKYIPHKVEERDEEGEESFEGYSLLLVEDNRTNRMMAEEMLNDIGFVIDAAENGKVAVDMAKKRRYDIVLMDVQMPIMDGFEATQRIRGLIEDNRINNMPIIALTANAMKGDKEKCIQIGMNDYLTKPVRRHELVKVIKKYIQPKVKEKSLTVSLLDGAEEILNEEIFSNYKSLMGKEFVRGIEGFLHDTRLLLNHIQYGLKHDEIKTIQMSSHSLKSSSATIGALELSSVARAVEKNAFDVIERGKNVRELEQENIRIIDEAFKRIAPLLDQYIQKEKVA